MLKTTDENPYSNNIRIQGKKNTQRMRIIVKKIDLIFLKLEKVSFFLAVIALVGIFTSMIYGVFSREILNNSVLWTNDIAGYFMVYLIFLASPWILREKGHVMVDIITSALKKKILKILSVFICFISLIVTVILFYFSSQMTMDYYVNDIVMLSNVPWPKFALILPIAIGSFLLMIRFAIEVLRSLFVDETIFPGDLPEL